MKCIAILLCLSSCTVNKYYTVKMVMPYEREQNWKKYLYYKAPVSVTPNVFIFDNNTGKITAIPEETKYPVETGQSLLTN